MNGNRQGRETGQEQRTVPPIIGPGNIRRRAVPFSIEVRDQGESNDRILGEAELHRWTQKCHFDGDSLVWKARATVQVLSFLWVSVRRTA